MAGNGGARLACVSTASKAFTRRPAKGIMAPAVSAALGVARIRRENGGTAQTPEVCSPAGRRISRTPSEVLPAPSRKSQGAIIATGKQAARP